MQQHHRRPVAADTYVDHSAVGSNLGAEGYREGLDLRRRGHRYCKTKAGEKRAKHGRPCVGAAAHTMFRNRNYHSVSDAG